MTRMPTTLTLSGAIVATLTANTSPATPLHYRNVFIIIKKAGVTEVFTGKTDPQGRFELPPSVLNSLPPGTYTIDAYFNGVTGQGAALNVAEDDVDYRPSDAHLTRELWPFTGFFGLQNPPTFNSVKAGSTAPIKFSLGSNRGLGIFASGYPRMATIDCTTGAQTGSFTPAQNSGFRFDSANRHYTYDWKTDKGWKGTCRQLVLRFADGTERILRFRLTA